MNFKEFKAKYEKKEVFENKNNVILEPVVSVCVQTYQHVNYIKECLDSILVQQTSFPFEVLLGEDDSTDGTREICLEYARKYPDKIKLFLHHRENNIKIDGSPTGRFNFMYNLFSSKGKYIAVCEGDDYWIDSSKLQMQVDFLEHNPDYELCFTNINVINDKGETKKEALITDNRPTEYEHKDLPIWAPTLTRVFKNRNFEGLMNTVLGFDSYMLLYQSKFGKLRFIDKLTGTYRVHEGGIYSSKSKAKRKETVLLISIESLELIDKSLFMKYFGMLFKKLVEIRYLDAALFKINKSRVWQAFQNYKIDMSLFLKVKIGFSFGLVSLPFIKQNKRSQVFLLKVLNCLFLY